MAQPREILSRAKRPFGIVEAFRCTVLYCIALHETNPRAQHSTREDQLVQKSDARTVPKAIQYLAQSYCAVQTCVTCQSPIRKRDGLALQEVFRFDDAYLLPLPYEVQYCTLVHMHTTISYSAELELVT